MVAPSGLIRGSADDGKRLSGDGRCIGEAVALILKGGGGLGEEGLNIAPGRRLADDGKRLSGDGRCFREAVALIY